MHAQAAAMELGEQGAEEAPAAAQDKDTAEDEAGPPEPERMETLGASKGSGLSVDFPATATGCRGQINLTLNEENGQLIASSIKTWEGRPLLGRETRISTRNKVCFQVGSRNDPWYILCDVLHKEDYDTLEDMLKVRVKDLLPHGPYDVQQAGLYYRGLGKRCRAGSRFIAFQVSVIGCWCGKSKGCKPSHRR